MGILIRTTKISSYECAVKEKHFVGEWVSDKIIALQKSFGTYHVFSTVEFTTTLLDIITSLISLRGGSAIGLNLGYTICSTKILKFNEIRQCIS